MSTYPSLAPKHSCTGCGACYNACQTDAINMAPDVEGFVYPSVNKENCIGCGLCEKACPVLHPVYVNTPKPPCYAMMASDEERRQSSTGAFIPAMAHWVLDNGGRVYGAVWNSDWSVHHVGADTREAFVPMRGSKYLQSLTEKTYQEALRDLKDDRWVLYTGTPCQIAGLNGFIGNKDYKKLITIEVICHGAPSYKVLHKYLDENFKISDITRISFREKSIYGWVGGFHIWFQDGNEFHEHADKNIFWHAFNPVMIQRPACATCPFSKLPRQADYSAGDFWGVSTFDRSLTDGLGTAFILENTSKHKTILDTLSKDFKLWKPIPLEAPARINRTIEEPFRPHPGRKHFFSCIDNKPFNNLVENSLKHHYDIGIVGLWYGINYGSVLTYYALYAILKKLGLDPVLLPKPDILWDDKFNAKDSIAQKFMWKHCNVFLPYPSMKSYKSVNNNCDTFIVGSDVVWNYKVCGSDAGHYFFFDFVHEGHKKIAYAPSCGGTFEGPELYRKVASVYLNDFNAISCREASTIDFLKENGCKKEISTVLDPVFLCDREEYDRIAAESTVVRNEKYCFSYLLSRDRGEDKNLFMKLICKVLNLQNIAISNPNATKVIREYYKIQTLDNIPIEDWIALIQQCSFYFGDSYHGLCFALIYHKPFIVIFSKKLKTVERFRHLLSLVGLEERLIDDEKYEIEDYIYIMQKKIDWGDVDMKLNDIKNESIKWLNNAIYN